MESQAMKRYVTVSVASDSDSDSDDGSSKQVQSGCEEQHDAVVGEGKFLSIEELDALLLPQWNFSLPPSSMCHEESVSSTSEPLTFKYQRKPTVGSDFHVDIEEVRSRRDLLGEDALTSFELDTLKQYEEVLVSDSSPSFEGIVFETDILKLLNHKLQHGEDALTSTEIAALEFYADDIEKCFEKISRADNTKCQSDENISKSIHTLLQRLTVDTIDTDTESNWDIMSKYRDSSQTSEDDLMGARDRAMNLLAMMQTPAAEVGGPLSEDVVGPPSDESNWDIMSKYRDSSQTSEDDLMGARDRAMNLLAMMQKGIDDTNSIVSSVVIQDDIEVDAGKEDFPQSKTGDVEESDGNGIALTTSSSSNKLYCEITTCDNSTDCDDLFSAQSKTKKLLAMIQSGIEDANSILISNCDSSDVDENQSKIESCKLPDIATLNLALDAIDTQITVEVGIDSVDCQLVLSEEEKEHIIENTEITLSCDSNRGSSPVNSIKVPDVVTDEVNLSMLPNLVGGESTNFETENQPKEMLKCDASAINDVMKLLDEERQRAAREVRSHLEAISTLYPSLSESLEATDSTAFNCDIIVDNEIAQINVEGCNCCEVDEEYLPTDKGDLKSNAQPNGPRFTTVLKCDSSDEDDEVEDASVEDCDEEPNLPSPSRLVESRASPVLPSQINASGRFIVCTENDSSSENDEKQDNDECNALTRFSNVIVSGDSTSDSDDSSKENAAKEASVSLNFSKVLCDTDSSDDESIDIAIDSDARCSDAGPQFNGSAQRFSQVLHDDSSSEDSICSSESDCDIIEEHQDNYPPLCGTNVEPICSGPPKTRLRSMMSDL
jgi:hypothetical protein